MRSRLTSLGFDALCVAALAVIGTRNHDTDTGPGAVFLVAAPFLLALVATSTLPMVARAPRSLSSGLVVSIGTVAAGMVLRNLVFDRGTATPFVVVASVFVLATTTGWRLVARWMTGRRSVGQPISRPG